MQREMSAQFLSSFIFNKVTFTQFRQVINPEDLQRINNTVTSLLPVQSQDQDTSANGADKLGELHPLNQKIEPTRGISMLRKVEVLEKAEYTEESDMESNDVKIERDHYGESRVVWAKQEAVVKSEGFGRFSETTSKSEMEVPYQEDFAIKLPMLIPADPLNLSDYLRKELEKIVFFILHNMGKVSQTEIENMRSHYMNNKCLLQIYDKLVIKYYSAKRCREDIVRYILRRAFREVRLPLMKEEKITTKKASLAVCKKYFQSTFEELERSGREIRNEEELLELLMPYTKKSKNRTMNTTFVHELFASQKFYEDYQVFLGEFDRIITGDNNKKIEQLLEFLMDCIKKDTLDNIGDYKRFPWLDTWIELTKEIAISLPRYKKSNKHSFKKVKL